MVKTAVVAAFALAIPAAAQAGDGFFDQIRVGILDHDVHVLGGREKGLDLNGEVQFVSPVPDSWGSSLPSWLRFILSPRPDAGAHVNTAGATSQAYAGLTWTLVRVSQILSPGDAVTFDFGVGPSLNNGHADTSQPDQKSLGSNILFRLSGELGYAISPRTAIYALYDHESNAGFARHNQSLNDIGLRVGWRF